MNTNNSPTTIATHKFGWNLTEIIGLSLFALVGAIILITPKIGPLGLVFVGGAIYLAFLSKGRKKASELVLTRTGDTLQMTRGGVAAGDGGNRINISEIKSVHYDRSGSTDAIVLIAATDETKVSSPDTLYLPLRIANQPEVLKIVRQLIDNSSIGVGREAFEWFRDQSSID